MRETKLMAKLSPEDKKYNREKLWRLIRAGDVRGVKALLRKDKSVVKAQNPHKNTPLHLAVLCLREKTDEHCNYIPNPKEFRRWTRKFRRIIDALLETGAKATAENDKGMFPSDLASVAFPIPKATRALLQQKQGKRKSAYAKHQEKMLEELARNITI